MGTAETAAPRVLDPWLAMLAGDRVWVDEDEIPDTRRRIAAAIAVLGLVFVVSLAWMTVIQRIGLGTPLLPSQIAAMVITLSALALALRPMHVLVGARSRPSGFTIRLIWRTAVFITLIVAIAYQMPGWSSVAGWALGVTIGADVTMSSWAIGIRPQPLRWWRRVQLSPAHFGVVGALAAVAVTPVSQPRLWSMVGPYLALQIGIVVAVLTCLALLAITAQLGTEIDAARREVADAERRHRAHWLHDDVLAEVRLTTLRLERGDLDTAGAAAALDEMDHHLRLRQLDELFTTGSVRLADIIQPHVRRTQALGVRFTAMPTLDAAGQRVDEEIGRRFARVVSLLMSNAVNAGASTVALGLETTDDAIIVRLADDAGGFELENVPAGRGLDSLASELGRHNLRRIALPDGSLMMATISTSVAARPIPGRPSADDADIRHAPTADEAMPRLGHISARASVDTTTTTSSSTSRTTRTGTAPAVSAVPEGNHHDVSHPARR